MYPLQCIHKPFRPPHRLPSCISSPESTGTPKDDMKWSFCEEYLAKRDISSLKAPLYSSAIDIQKEQVQKFPSSSVLQSPRIRDRRRLAATVRQYRFCCYLVLTVSVFYGLEQDIYNPRASSMPHPLLRTHAKMPGGRSMYGGRYPRPCYMPVVGLVRSSLCRRHPVSASGCDELVLF